MKILSLQASLRLLSFCLLILTSLAAAQEERTLVVSSIDIRGLTKTDSSVIYHYLSFRPGDPVSQIQLSEAQNNLLATNFFKEVTVYPLPAAVKGHILVVIEVVERKWPNFEFKSGYNELDGWYLSPLGLRFDNTFGRGNHLAWEAYLGDRVAGSRLEYIRPYFLDSEYDIYVEIFGQTRQFLQFVTQGDSLQSSRFMQRVRNSGTKIKVTGNSGIPRFFSVSLIGYDVQTDSILTDGPEGVMDIYAPSYLERDLGTTKVRSLRFTASLDTRDRQINPSGGWWGMLGVDQATAEFGSEVDFSRITIDLRHYQRFWKQINLAGRVRWGRISEQAPFYEKFYLGGANSLRGYEDRSLTPEGYAANIAQASLEVRFPLSGRPRHSNNFTGVIFYDIGNAWNGNRRIEFDDLKSGAGFGVRMHVPILGIIRFDAGYSLPDYEFRGHFSLGHTF